MRYTFNGSSVTSYLKAFVRAYGQLRIQKSFKGVGEIRIYPILNLILFNRLVHYIVPTLIHSIKEFSYPVNYSLDPPLAHVKLAHVTVVHCVCFRFFVRM